MNLLRKHFLPGLIALALPSFALAEDRPNFLVIMVDDLKPSFGAYGDEWVHAPAMDQLAEESVRFDRAYANQAVCMASRVSFMLGSRPTSTGIYNFGTEFRQHLMNPLPLPELLKNEGWHTEAIGKVYHVGHGNTDDAASWSVPSHYEKVIDYVLPDSTPDGKLTREEAYFSNQSPNYPNGTPRPRGAAWERADVLDEAYADGRIASQAIRRLKLLKDQNQPFFLTVGFVRPHMPFSAPEKYWRIYDGMEMPTPERTEPPEGAPRFAGKVMLGELNQYFPVPEKAPMEKELIQNLIQGYYASVSYMDAQLGRLMEEVEALGLKENTVIVLWGDHGFSFGHLGNWTKHTNYEQAVRQPLMIRAPGISVAGGVAPGVVETVDIFTTILELAGLEAPDAIQPIDGKSLVPVLRDPEHRVQDHIYHAFARAGHLGRAIRTERYRMVEWTSMRNPGAAKPVYELYDYAEDPEETRNHARHKPEVLAELAGLLASHPPAKR